MPLAERLGKLVRVGSKLSTDCDQGDCIYCTGNTENRSMRVVIGGMQNSGCSNCTNINATHDLTYSGSCQWSKSVSDCSATIRMDMTAFAGSTVLEVRVILTDGTVLWRKTYGAGTDPQDCSAFSSESIAYQSNTSISQCNHDASTAATVTSL